MIQFRRLLPLCALVIAIGLMLLADGQNRVQSAQCAAAAAELRWEQTAAQMPDAVVLPPRAILSPRYQTSTSLSIALVAVGLPGIPLAVPFSALGGLFTESTLPDHLGWCLGIVLVWYSIGRRLDFRRSGDPSLRSEPRFAIRAYISLVVVLSPLALIALLGWLAFARHGQLAAGNRLLVSALAVWSAAGVYVLQSWIRGVHDQP